MKVTVVRDIMDANRRVAEQNRRLFESHGLLVVNLLSSPGAGKTTLLERTIRDLGPGFRIGVVEGDIQTSLDAERVERAGAAFAHQINTFGACHIDGNMVAPALEQADLSALDLLVVENVGNLVCPAEFDVGEDFKVLVYALTEGEDKPKKYPLAFHESAVVLLNKIDLLPHLGVDRDLCRRNVRDVNPRAEIFEVSARTGEGLDGFYDWLRDRIREKRARRT